MGLIWWKLDGLIWWRKRIGILASEHWKGDYPKFNTPEKKVQLHKFASQIEAECGIPEIGFTTEGIAQHIQDFFNEQRRYKKRNKGQHRYMYGLPPNSFYYNEGYVEKSREI